MLCIDVGAQYESSSPERVGRHVHQVWWCHARGVSSSRQGNSSPAAGGSQEGIGCQGNPVVKNTCNNFRAVVLIIQIWIWKIISWNLR